MGDKLLFTGCAIVFAWMTRDTNADEVTELFGKLGDRTQIYPTFYGSSHLVQQILNDGRFTREEVLQQAMRSVNATIDAGHYLLYIERPLLDVGLVTLSGTTEWYRRALQAHAGSVGSSDMRGNLFEAEKRGLHRTECTSASTCTSYGSGFSCSSDHGFCVCIGDSSCRVGYAVCNSATGVCDVAPTLVLTPSPTPLPTLALTPEPAPAPTRAPVSTTEEIPAEELVELIQPLYVVLLFAGGGAIVVACATRFLIRVVRLDDIDCVDVPATVPMFLFVEGIDLITEIGNLFLVFLEGDLDFAGEGHCVKYFLVGSVLFSFLMYQLEVGIACKYGRTPLYRWLFSLVCLHICFEDSFQLVLYACVAASQAASGVGAPVAPVAAVVVTVATLASKVVATVWPSMDYFEGVRRGVGEHE